MEKRVTALWTRDLYVLRDSLLALTLAFRSSWEGSSLYNLEGSF